MADTEFDDGDQIYTNALQAMGYLMGLRIFNMGVPIIVFIPFALTEKQEAELLEIAERHAEKYEAAVLADMQNLFGTNFATETEVGARLEVAAEAGLGARVYDEDLGYVIGPRPRFAGFADKDDDATTDELGDTPVPDAEHPDSGSLTD